ncbi:MAG TPA: DM9 repeat-containing protein [Chitinispirillaceae bacterium]|nr:DM9 repeat-containing protein [Chitinispirillaceae bacterium]
MEQRRATEKVYEWVPASNGTIPPGAVVGGHEPGRDLYVCRATYHDGVHPGKLVGNCCSIGWGGREITLPNYEVLVSSVPSSLQWVPASNGAVPSNAVVGGHEPGRDLYVCRAAYHGGVHPGKLVGNCCNIGWGGREIMLLNYEVLVCALSPDGSHHTPTFYVSKDDLIVKYGQGIDIVNGGTFPSIFSSFPTPIPVGSPTPEKKSEVTIVNSVDEYKNSVTAEASLGGKYKDFSLNAKGSWVSKQSKNTQAVVVLASGWQIGQTFQPDFSKAVLNVNLSAFTSYSEFIARYGSHFIGGCITGASYVATYTMECKTNSDAETLSANVNAAVEGSNWGVNLSVSITNARESSGIQSKIKYDHHAIGWTAPTLQLNNPAESLDNNIKSFDRLTPEQLSNPVAYICYDWRMIPAIRACKWGKDPDINMLAVQQNLPYIMDAYQELSYVGTLAETALDNLQYRGEQDRQTLIGLKGTMNQLCLKLLSFSARDVAELNVGDFSQKYNGEILLQQITDIMLGWKYRVQIWTLKKTKGLIGTQFYGNLWLEAFNKEGEPQGKRIVIWSTDRDHTVKLKMNTRNWIRKDKQFFFETVAKVKETAYIQLSGELRERGGLSERDPSKGETRISLKDILKATQQKQPMSISFVLKNFHNVEVNCIIRGDVI